MKKKVIRISTVPVSLAVLLKGQLNYLNQYYQIVGASSGGEALDIVQEQENISVKAIEIKRQIDIKMDIVSLWNLYRFLKKEKPLIVHSITPKAGLLSMVAAKLAGIPIRVHTFTGLIFPYRRGILQKVLILMDRILCLCATNIYPEGVGVMNDLISYKITSKPLKVLANGNVNGIDTDYFNPSLFDSVQNLKLMQKMKIKEGNFIFIFVGRLVSEKGLNELVEVFDEISRENLHTKLLLIGPIESDSDPLKPETIRIMDENPQIILTGLEPDIRPFLAVSDALVFPSYREGFPNVVIQAGAMGLPSIVTDISGSNEIIINEKNGSIIPVKDTQALKEKMKLYIADEKLVSRLSANSRPMIKSRYEQKVVWDALLNEYKLLEKTNYV